MARIKVGYLLENASITLTPDEIINFISLGRVMRNLWRQRYKVPRYALVTDLHSVGLVTLVFSPAPKSDPQRTTEGFTRKELEYSRSKNVELEPRTRP